MWETIKNNVLLKGIIVAILGVLGFGLAFNIMFGRNTGMMAEGMNGGYSLDGTLAYILAILVKLLLIALVLMAFITIYRLAVKYLLRGGESKMFDAYKNDPGIKAAATVIVGVLVIALIAMLFGNIFGGYGITQSYYGIGMNAGYGVSALLALLAKLLLIISVVGLVVSAAIYFLQGNFRLVTKQEVKAARKEETSHACSKCGMSLKSEWKCCPECGEEVEACVTSSVEGEGTIVKAEKYEEKADEKLTTIVQEKTIDDADSSSTKKKHGKR